MNISLVGPNLLLAPDANPSDGTLDFVLVTEDRRDELDQYLQYRLEQKRDDAPALIVRRGRRLRFTWHGSVVRFDDRAWPKGTTHRQRMARKVSKRLRADRAAGEISLRRGGLELLIPRGSPMTCRA
jgi:hypothetical protein